MKFLKIKFWKVNIFRKWNSIRCHPSNVSKKKKKFTKKIVLIKNKIYQVLVSVSLIKKNRFMKNVWVNPRGTGIV